MKRDDYLYMDSILNNVTVVVIDTGADITHALLKDANITGFYITKRNEKYEILKDIHDEIGHGTAICGILHKMNSKLNIIMLKIYNRFYDVNEEVLVFALTYVMNNIRCDIINMSLGILTPSEKLHDICCRLNKKGIIIVSAFDNSGSVSYPAAYDEVIGVDSSKECVGSEDFIYVEKGIVNLRGKGGNNRIAWLNHKYVIDQGSSYSSAYITAYISKLIYYNPKAKYNIKNELKSKAIKIYYDQKTDNKIEEVAQFKIYKAAVFPYNKEVHSIVNFSDMLNFELKEVYDLKYQGNIGKNIKNFNGSRQFTIKNYLDIKWNEIDTLIIGHVQEMSKRIRVNIKEVLLEKCLENRVNVYSFDSDSISNYIERFKRRNLKIYYPHKSNKYIEKFGKLYAIRCPVIGVFGTTSVQGKYTLQLQLRKLFLKDNFKVGQIGTEPSALLFGMDDAFTFGYASTVQINGSYFIESLNESMHLIDIKDPDIILAGCQSGTIPKYYFNMNLLNYEQLNFLLGINPDLVILCVNLYDDLDYIKRCILSIENLVECKIPVIAISPLVFENEWNKMNNRKVIANDEQIENFKKQIKILFGLNSFVIGRNEITNIYDICIECLS